MNRKILALGGAVAALAVGHSYAQQGFGEGGSCRQAPPGSGEQLCLDQRAWYDQGAAPNSAAAPVAVGRATSPLASTPLDTPPLADPVSQDLAVNDIPETAAASVSQPVTDQDLALTDTTQSTASATGQSAVPETAPAPSAADVSATAAATDMAYAKDIANAPGGVFKAKVGDYKMSAYASPPRPLPYDQLDAYLRATPGRQASNDWWAGSQLAEAAPTASTSDVSATVDQAPSAGHAGIPGDTPTGLSADTPAPRSPAPAPDAAPAPDPAIDNMPI